MDFYNTFTFFFLNRTIFVEPTPPIKRGPSEVEKAPVQKEANLPKPVRAGDLIMGREPKRKRQDEQFEDISMETVAQIISTIDDPNYMTGPDVRYSL